MNKKVRGTRFITGEEAEIRRDVIQAFTDLCKVKQFQEIVVPALYSPDIFKVQAGEEIENQMWCFEDKGGRDVCLIPEATAIVQEYYRPNFKSLPKPINLFYETRCYRYERPQLGRYREFTQFGVEVLGQKDIEKLQDMAVKMLQLIGLKNYTVKSSVKRGLHYYEGDGFEIECDSLGAQKQICGGGIYDLGAGFAFGIDRVVLALMRYM